MRYVIGIDIGTSGTKTMFDVLRIYQLSLL